MQSAFKDLKLFFKEYLKHVEQQSNTKRRVRQIQEYREMSFSEPVEQLRARSLRVSSDESALKVCQFLPQLGIQRYVKQEWSNVFPIVTQLRFESVELSGIRNIMTQIKHIHIAGLKSLTLSHCHIQSIQTLQFMNLNVLKQLNLSHNAIVSLRSLRKINSSCLENLDVSDNCLVTLQFIEQIKMSKHMKQIIIEDSLQEINPAQSINCLWKMQVKHVRVIRFETLTRVSGLYSSRYKKQRFRLQRQ